jgi:general L-amino acid transport system substrate-binding protein
VRKLTWLAMTAWMLTAAAAGPAMSGPTQDGVRNRGQMSCGVNVGIAGFSMPDSQGVWRGFDVDICRAVAAAVLGDGSKVRFVPLTGPQRFIATQSGEVDVLIRQTTFTLTRDASLGLRMTAPTSMMATPSW